MIEMPKAAREMFHDNLNCINTIYVFEFNRHRLQSFMHLLTFTDVIVNRCYKEQQNNVL